MTRFQGFATRKEAEAFVRKNGGLLTYAYTPTGRKSRTYKDYMYAVNLGGLDKDKYPYCVQWNADRDIE